MAYETTSVAVEKSQGDIRKLLTDHGATQFTFGEGEDLTGTRWGGVEFIHGGHMVRMKVPLKPPDDRWMRQRLQRARSRTSKDFEREHYDQEARRIWRVMYWSLKARMVAIDEQVETFEQAFLAHIVDPGSNRTLWEHIRPGIEAGALRLGGGGLRELPMWASTYEVDDVVEAEVEP